jgi:ABC-2 type transport system ATP-binding protein
VVSIEPDQTTAEVQSTLRQAGISVIGIRPIEPSLEDVFISVLGEKEKTVS